jgi:hypothetical protein
MMASPSIYLSHSLPTIGVTKIPGVTVDEHLNALVLSAIDLVIFVMASTLTCLAPPLFSRRRTPCEPGWPDEPLLTQRA